MERRTYVGGTVSLLTVGLAGCAGDSVDGSSSDSGPEAVAQTFFETAGANNTERQAALIHNESTTVEPLTEDLGVTITELETRTLEEIAEERDQSLSEAELEDTRQRLQSELDEIGAVEYSYVYFDISTDEYGSEEGYLLLVDDGEAWQIYSYGVGFELEPTVTTGEESTQEVSDRLQMLSITGNVTANETIDEITVTVAKTSGSNDINLEDVTYEFITEEGGAVNLLTTDQISVISAETDDNTITNRSDRYELTFVAPTHLDGELEAGDRVTLKLTTAAGTVTITELQVPDSLEDRDAVRL